MTVDVESPSAKEGRGGSEANGLPPQTRIAWSKEQQAFLAVPATATIPRQHQPTSSRRKTKASDFNDFASMNVDCKDISSIKQFVAMRVAILARVQGSKQVDEPAAGNLAALPEFLELWRRKMDKAFSPAQVGAGSLCEESRELICQEFQQFAETAMSLGDVVCARAALARCIHLARQCNSSAQCGDDECDGALYTAKTFLLRCVRFQYDKQRCEPGLQRTQAPPQVVRGIFAIVETLRALAPLSVDVEVLRVDVLLRMHRVKEVLAILSVFPFTSASAQLTLAFARALEYEGFYQNSIDQASQFCEKKVATSKMPDSNDSDQSQEDVAWRALVCHERQLKAVVANKTEAETALVRSEYQDAERAFSAAICIVHSDSHRLRGALLLGRANALIGLERLLSARRDLEESLRLDPSNVITRMRLRTVELEVATHAMYRRMKM